VSTELWPVQIQVEPNRFDKAWSPPPTVEEVSLSGGYIYLGLNYALYMAGKGMMKVTGARPPIQPATARPAPLDAATLERGTPALPVRCRLHHGGGALKAHSRAREVRQWRPRHDSNVRPSP
jgi:hypothetical protein